MTMVNAMTKDFSDAAVDVVVEFDGALPIKRSIFLHFVSTFPAAYSAEYWRNRGKRNEVI